MHRPGPMVRATAQGSRGRARASGSAGPSPQTPRRSCCRSTPSMRGRRPVETRGLVIRMTYGAVALTLGARVPTGEAFTDAQRQEISRAVAEAQAESDWEFAVEVGPCAEDTRAYAEAL